MITAFQPAKAFDCVRIGPFDYDVVWYQRGNKDPEKNVSYVNLDTQTIGVSLAKPQAMADYFLNTVFMAILNQLQDELVIVCTEDEFKKSAELFDNDIEDTVRKLSLVMIQFIWENPNAMAWLASCKPGRGLAVGHA